MFLGFSVRICLSVSLGIVHMGDDKSRTEELNRLYKNLEEIEKRKGSFIDDRNASPDLWRNEAETKSKIARIEAEMMGEGIASGMISDIMIPIVVASMDASQASNLLDYSIFSADGSGPAEKAKFELFANSLEPDVLKHQIANYGDTPDEWKPYSRINLNISEILMSMLHIANQKFVSNNAKISRISPNFLTTQFFSPDDQVKHATWIDLLGSPCLVIVDGISLFHPAIYDCLLQSNITSHPHAATVVISPVDYYGVPTNFLIEKEWQSKFELAHVRFDKALDRFCEVGAGDIRSLQRWLHGVIPETVLSVQSTKPDPRKLENLREIIGPVPDVGGNIFYYKGDER